MTESQRRSLGQPYRVPLSGTVLGVIVKEFLLTSPVLISKRARRYFRGQRIKDDNRFEVIEAIAAALEKEGFVPTLPFLDRNGWPAAGMLTLAIAWYAEQWDALAGYMRSASAPVERPDLAATAYLRLVAIDLALRTSALLWLAELPSPQEGVPVWAEPRGNARYLRGLLERCGSSAPTRDELAEQLSVSYNTVDSWLDAGVRPSLQNLQKIAGQLAEHMDGVDPTALVSEMRLHYAVSSLGDSLASHIGREAVLDLATAFIRFTSRNLDGLRTFSKLAPDAAASAQMLILMLGARFKSCEHLVRALWRREKDPVWRADLQAVCNPWHLRLGHLMKNLGGLDQGLQILQEEYGIPKEAAGNILEQVLSKIPADPTIPEWVDPAVLEELNFVRVKGDAAYSARNRITQYQWARAKGDFATAIRHVRRAVELQPGNALYHFELGATLGTAGEIREGIQECWIAHQLDPSWELPKVEVGIILLNDGRSEEARDHLEGMAHSQEALSGHLAFNLGIARQRCGDFGLALAALLRVIELQSDHALALDAAADCAFMMDDMKLGRQFAKKANALGQSETYESWRKGRYRGRRS